MTRGKASTGKENKPVFPKDTVFEKAADYKSIYANHTFFQMTALDLSIVFGEVTSLAEDKLTVEQKVKITVSPQEVKVLANLLLLNLARYEQLFGKINDVPTSEMKVALQPKSKSE